MAEVPGLGPVPEQALGPEQVPGQVPGQALGLAQEPEPGKESAR